MSGFHHQGLYDTLGPYITSYPTLIGLLEALHEKWPQINEKTRLEATGQRELRFETTSPPIQTRPYLPPPRDWLWWKRQFEIVQLTDIDSFEGRNIYSSRVWKAIFAFPSVLKYWLSGKMWKDHWTRDHSQPLVIRPEPTIFRLEMVHVGVGFHGPIVRIAAAYVPSLDRLFLNMNSLQYSDTDPSFSFTSSRDESYTLRQGLIREQKEAIDERTRGDGDALKGYKFE